MVNEGDGGALGWGNGPTASQEVYLVVGIDAAAQVERQMQVQQCRGWARTYGRALFGQGLVPSSIGAEARGAANGGVLVGDLAIQYGLGGGGISDVFVRQERYQAQMQRFQAAVHHALCLWARGNPLCDAPRL